jgi:hypothetical protein
MLSLGMVPQVFRITFMGGWHSALGSQAYQRDERRCLIDGCDNGSRRETYGHGSARDEVLEEAGLFRGG